jgi:hypothetical protein
MLTFTRCALFSLYLLHKVAAINVPPTVQKCCQTNEALNISPMFCASTANQSAAILHFDAPTHFGRPHCQDDVVVVEYSSSKTALTLENDVLIVPLLNNSEASVRIPANLFCLDNALNDDQQWAAWVCQPSSICDHVPCVQKCCGPSEHLAQVDTIPQCVAHDNKKPFVPAFSLAEDSSAPEKFVEGWHHQLKISSHLMTLFQYLESNITNNA